MAVALLIGLWVWDEMSFNQSHPNYDHIAQVTKWSVHHGETVGGGKSSLAYPLSHALKTNYGHLFRHIVTAGRMQEYILSAGEKKLSQTGQFIEAGAPEMLSLRMRLGSWAGLRDPHSILLSASTARALFGDTNPLDQRVKINKKTEVQVTGVYEDLPHNTEFHEDRFFAPWDLYIAENAWIKKQDWKNHFLYIYVQIRPGSTFDQVSAAIQAAEINSIQHLENMQDLVAEQPRIALFPMSEWHLYGDFKGDIADSGPVQFVRMVGMIGGFVLLLACINFMNLSTARSEKRAREVGIRKAIGSRRGQLIHQFLGESFLVSLLAFGCALVLVEVSLPWFNELAGKQLSLLWSNVWFWLTSLGLLAGSYPALYLSSFNPVSVLKGGVALGTFRVGRSATLPREVLVVLLPSRSP
jgi:putative ABC transport system permease protein